ncbi:HAD-IIIA family hydrolase [Paenibacillaceae bacterium]|nr:HAD-IIIA family hydrolase [Paenibacillaceae bacterium]
MSINAVLFDLDNTLINRKLAFEEFSNKLVDNYLVVSDPSERNEIVHYIIEADNDGYRSKKELYQELLRNLKWKKETTLEELLDYWFSEFFKCTVLMNGAMDVIHVLRNQGLKLGLITNGSVHSQNAKIDCAKIRHLFDVIVVSDEVQVKKPDKRIFEIALERLGVKPETSFYIGDHPLNDIKGASEAGLKTIWLAGFREWDVAGVQPHYTVKELKELITIFES